jgi:hypothetical protein
MSLSYLARKDLFYVEFTRNFVPDEVAVNYNPYVDRMPTQISDARTLVESSLQGINIPSYQYDGVEQFHVDTLNHNQIGTNYRSSMNTQDLTNKSLNLTFKLLSGYINYWIMLDTFFFHYDFPNPKAFIGDISIRILDEGGNVMMTRIFKDCIMTGIGDFELAYSDNLQTFETFTVDLQYSVAETTFANPGDPSNFGENNLVT